ncbi:MAG: hypothetical protein ACE5EE_02045 [Fidelibacterota bacterium]
MFEDYSVTNILLLIVSLLVILMGVLMLFAPSIFEKWMKSMDKVIALFDVKVLSNRFIWGIILLISAIFLFYTAFTL